MDQIRCWIARRKSELVLEIIRGKTIVAEAIQTHNSRCSEIEKWFEDGKRGIKSALRATSRNLREQYEMQLKGRQECDAGTSCPR